MAVARIIKLDFVEADKIWVAIIRGADGRRYQAQFSPTVFQTARLNPMGQLMLHGYFARGSVIPEERPIP